MKDWIRTHQNINDFPFAVLMKKLKWSYLIRLFLSSICWAHIWIILYQWKLSNWSLRRSERSRNQNRACRCVCWAFPLMHADALGMNDHLPAWFSPRSPAPSQALFDCHLLLYCVWHSSHYAVHFISAIFTVCRSFFSRHFTIWSPSVPIWLLAVSGGPSEH